MDFYVIPPLSNLELMHKGKGDRYFCLAQLYMQNKEYRDFFLNLPDNAWITLDNGAGDHDLVTEDALFNVMKELRPSEVIPPDVLFKADVTVENAKKFYDRMVREQMTDIEVFFCPQGLTREQWLNCYVWGLDQDWIKTIGLSKIAVPKAFLDCTDDVGIMESRHNCFNYLKVHGLLEKPIHLLGMGDPREFEYYYRFDSEGHIRSSDSCNTVWSAMNEQLWRNGQFKRIPTPRNYFNRKIAKDKLPLINANIAYLIDHSAGW